jgi:hypothetical protein
MVVPQHAAEALPALDIANGPANFGARIDDLVSQSLMIALLVVEQLNAIPPNTKNS